MVSVPGSVGAAGRSGAGEARASGFSRAEAREVLHHAQHLMQPDAGSKTARPRARDLTLTLRDLRLARPALATADRRQADRLLSRSTPAAQARAAAAGPKLLCSDHFCVHYASPTTTAWATTTINTLEHVWSVEVPMMGRAPLPDGGTSGDADNPNDKLDVYLEDLGDQGLYGYCTSDDNSGGTQVPAYCALDDDFARSQYGAAPINSLRVTAAHEFFHAIQFAADVTEDAWFMEGSATYMEDVVYDSINDNYQYLPSSAIRHPRTSLEYAGGSFAYGAFIFFAYASQRSGLDVIRRFWDAAVGPRQALQAVRSVVGTGAWPAYFTTYGSWNTLPLHSYPERASYPAPAWWERRTLTASTKSTGLHGVRIAHLGSAAVLAIPGPNLAGEQEARGAHRRTAERDRHQGAAPAPLPRRPCDAPHAHARRERQPEHRGRVQPTGAARHRGRRGQHRQLRPHPAVPGARHRALTLC